MHIDDFRQAQRSRATQDLSSLFMSCRRKFLNAARLLELRGPVFDKLNDSDLGTADLWPLMSMFDLVCDRYAEDYFTSQDDLFNNPSDTQDMRWGRYFHHVLIPHLIRDDDFVRNILRAMMVIPCKNPRLAGDSLVQHISEMTLPGRRPPWAPEDEIGA